MSDDATYEANTVPELQAELDKRKIEYASHDLKADLIKLLEDDDGGKGDGSAAGRKTDGPDVVNPAAAESDLVPTEAGNPPELSGAESLAVERSDTRGVALGDIPLLDPTQTVGAAPRIPEGFESAAASARGARAEALVVEIGRQGIEDVQAAIDAHPATGGEFLVEASGPVAVSTADTEVDDADLVEA